MHITGRIRPGIKVLKKAFADNQKAQNIYKRGMLAGVGFKSIENALEKEGIKSALVPKNEPFFSVWEQEFKNPETARKILDTYGEQREGDPVKRLYRFPVIFLGSDPYRMIMSRYEAYSASGLKFWSVEQGNGERLCKTKGEVPKQRNGRVVRLSRGRPDVVRGNCVPEECPEFQRRECNERHHIVVAIPGATNAVEFVEIPTGSFYGSDQVKETLKAVATVCGGSIPLDVQMGYKGHPIFWMSKALEKVSRITDTGEVQRVPQILARLDADIEMAHLVTLAENAFNKAQFAARNMLPNSAAEKGLSIEHKPAAVVDDIIPTTTASPEPEKVFTHEEDQQRHEETFVHLEEPTKDECIPSSQPQHEADVEEIKVLRKELFKLCNETGITSECIIAYGTVRYGDNWGRNPVNLKTVLREIHLAQEINDIDGAIAEMNNVINDAKNKAS